MSIFGRCGGGGRRSAKRQNAPLVALLTMLTEVHTGTLVDVSATGARLRGLSLPALGQEFMLKIERVEAFARVVWRQGLQCGVTFDQPLSAFELQLLRRAAGLGCMSKLSPEDRLALDDWITGKAR